MQEMKKHGEVGRAAAKADMDRKTARKYIRAGKLPSELAQPRSWRTRENPFSPEDWAAISAASSTTFLRLRIYPHKAHFALCSGESANAPKRKDTMQFRKISQAKWLPRESSARKRPA